MGLDEIKDKFLNKQPLFIGQETAFESAVIIPLVKVEGEWHILFEVRSLKMNKQPGDISFPGGKIDATDLSPKEAAIRETCEELGLDNTSVNILSEMSPFILSPSFVIYPFIAEIPNEENYRFNKDEVKEIIKIPLEWLLEHKPYNHFLAIQPRPNDDFPYDKISNGKKYQWREQVIEEWFYEYEEYTVWGITARILKYFLEQFK